MDVEDAKLIEDLALPYRAATAMRIFMRRGAAAVPVLVEGLQHSDAEARYQCCRLLDQLLTPGAMQPLLKMLDDPDARVRVSALHSLSCDRCKTDICLATDGPLLKKAIQLLDTDPDAHVRAMAIEAVARSSHTEPTAEAAIVRSMSTDASSVVRKKARWYAPGGKIHERSKVRHHQQASRTGDGRLVRVRPAAKPSALSAMARPRAGSPDADSIPV